MLISNPESPESSFRGMMPSVETATLPPGPGTFANLMSSGVLLSVAASEFQGLESSLCP